jgi:hypothetical protein
MAAKDNKNVEKPNSPRGTFSASAVDGLGLGRSDKQLPSEAEETERQPREESK